MSDRSRVSAHEDAVVPQEAQSDIIDEDAEDEDDFEEKDDGQRHVRFSDEPMSAASPAPPDTKKRPASRAHTTAPKKKIISDACPNAQYVRMQLVKTDLERNKFLRRMGKGAILYKFNSRTGVPEKRWFIVSPDGSTLSWTKPTRGVLGVKTTKRENLADALYLTYGCAENAKPGDVPAWLCFSIIFCEKSGSGNTWVTKEINVGCRDQNQLETWFFGIQTLIPLHHQHKSTAYVLWERAMMKVESMADEKKSEPAEIWRQLFEDAIRHVKGSSYKFIRRRLVHMNLARLVREVRSKSIDLGNQMGVVSNAQRSPRGLSPRTDRKRRLFSGDNVRLSPASTPRRLATAHDLTERMINRKPYVEKKVPTDFTFYTFIYLKP
ncbi:hypothetical protein AAMO2058_000527600 [Amorphochlora amoebiformis]